jgi:dimethylargininase
LYYHPPMDIAITRDVSEAITRCELTHLQREPIDFERAVAQHRAYCDRLQAKGFHLVRLPAGDAPDGVFVEDTAVVLDEVAVITMPGASSRRAELPPIESALAPYRPLRRIQLPATLDGGDVLRFGRRLFVGRSTRTNPDGIEALRRATEEFGYTVEPVAVQECLHLKSAATALDDETLVVNPAWTSGTWLDAFRVVDVDPREPAAACILRVRDEVWAHPGFPRTFEAITRHGYRVVPMGISEFLKAEAGLTCKSLLFQDFQA